MCAELDSNGLARAHDADGVNTYCLLGDGGKPSPEEIRKAVARPGFNMPVPPGRPGTPVMPEKRPLDITAHVVFDRRVLYVDCVSDQALQNTRRRVERALGSSITHVEDVTVDAGSITVSGHSKYIM